MEMRSFAPFALALAMVMTGGCSTAPADAEAAVQRSSGLASESLEGSRSAVRNVRPRVVEDDRSYLRPGRELRPRQLPPVFHEPFSVTEAVQVPVSRAAERISAFTGIRTTVAREVYDYLEEVIEGQAPDATDRLSRTAMGSGSGPHISMSYRHGTLIGFLDSMAAAMHSSWRYDARENRIEFFRYMTRTWDLATTASSLALDATLTNTSSTGDSADAGTGGSQTRMRSEFDPWSNVERNVQGLLSPQGSVTVMRDSGQITVKDTPESVAAVSAFVRDLNRQLLQEVVIEVVVLSVNGSLEDTRGINGLLNLQSNTGPISFAPVGGVPGAAGVLTGSVLPTSGSLGRMGGSTLNLENLAASGDASIMTTATLRSLSNRPVPLTVGDRIAYISSSGVILDGTGIATTQSELSELSVGFALNITPRVLSAQNRVLLNIGINISQLNELVTIPTGPDSVVQAPNISSRDFMQSVSLISGDTLVISGFERQMDTLDRSAAGPTPRWWPLGGRRSAETRSESIVVILRPFVLDGSERAASRTCHGPAFGCGE